MRRVAVWVLVGLATLLALVCSLTVWVDRQMLDNQVWKKASQQLIEDPEVRSALSVYLVNQLYANVDVTAALEKRLPKDLDPLAAPAAAALRQPAASAVNFMLQRPRVQTLWINASATAHDKLINVLEDKTGLGISTGSGVVTIDLTELVQQLGTEIGLPQSALAKLPPDAGTVTVMTSKQLSTVQTAVQLVHALSVWLLALVLGMYALAVYLARGARRTTLRTVAWAFVGVGLVLLIVRKLAGNYVIDALTTPVYSRMAHAVWLIETSILGQLALAMIFYGIVGLIGVTLAGPSRIACRMRAAAAPALRDHAGASWGALGFVFLLLVWWGGTHALRTWWGIVLIAGLLAAGFAALRRQTLAESMVLAPASDEPISHEKHLVAH